jgi:tRNA1(Val) A37 N6-methylase TrmN6
MSAHVNRVIGIEIQPELAKIATGNSILNNLSSRFDVVEADIRNHVNSLVPGSVDLIVANPPFWPATRDRLPKSEQRKIARHELMGTIGEWCQVAAQLLEPRRGRFCVVFPARRLDALVMSLADNGLSARRICLVHPNSAKPAELALVSARPGIVGQLQITPPLFLKASDGNDDEIAARIFSGEFSETISSHPDSRH